ncbi:hypothetical protein GJAV_G00134450 [Gymnothorax javanicus]|nr:hypothetical protein GJAV_G00134450 [Gymnothorax javanicus]
MAAVAAEPGAAAASTTVGDGTEFESEANLQTEATDECASAMDLMHLPGGQDAAAECRLVNAETRDRPEQEAAGKAYVAGAEEEQIEAGCPEDNIRGREVEIPSEHRGWADHRDECDSFKAEFSPVLLEMANEVSAFDSITRLQPSPTPISTSEPSVVVLHSHCTPLVSGMETGLAAPLLSSVEPVETKTEYVTSRGSDAPTEPAEIVCEVRALIKPLLVVETECKSSNDIISPELGTGSTEDAVLKGSEFVDHSARPPVLEKEKLLGPADENSDFTNIFACNSSDPPEIAVDQAPPVLESEDLYASRRVCHVDPIEAFSESEPAAAYAKTTGLPPDSVAHLSPGSEVRVSLDHIIDDALVVSFQLGEKIFSGVLMDLSKRFGPYGIPVTVFPRRDERDRPESMQLKTEPLLLDAKEGEGAPYPPPLFIRDTYSQSIPQPPPRKIKRPKRRLYREEPTSIMSAIRLRPRQVLCDKCKGTVTTADKREIRRGPDYPAGRGRRRNVGAAIVWQQGGGGGGNRVPRGVTGNAATAPTSNAKKVLQSKNVDHSKAREVLKMAKAQRRQRETVVVTVADAKARTRAAALQDAHQKVHFTRRLHRISGGKMGRLAGSSPLPSRIRIKPQRYCNGKNLVGLPMVQGVNCAPIPKPARPSSTHTPSSLGNPTPVAIKKQVRDSKLKPEPQPCLMTQPLPLPNTEPDPQVMMGHLQGDLKEASREEGRQVERGEKEGGRANKMVCYATLNCGRPTSSNTSVCTVDSLESSNSESCFSGTLVSQLPNTQRPVPLPRTSSSRQGRKHIKSPKVSALSETVSKRVSPNGSAVRVGNIVWAKIRGFPWWPARVQAIRASRKGCRRSVEKEAQVLWFGSSTTSFLALSRLFLFLENFQLRFDPKRKGQYRSAVMEAAKAAKRLNPEVRALLVQLEMT